VLTVRVHNHAGATANIFVSCISAVELYAALAPTPPTDTIQRSASRARFGAGFGYQRQPH